MILIYSLAIIFNALMVSSLKYMYKEIEINKLYKDKIEKSEMKMFSLKLDSETQGKDLIVDARMEGLTDHVLESPIVVVSLKPLPNNDKSSEWVCGQLGLESCFIPNRHLTPGETVYIGLFCQDCKFTIKTFYLKEEILKDGEGKLFHLKAGDKKIFKLDEFFQNEKEWINISSFNLKMTKYTMNVQIINQQKEIVSVPVKANWIGGQQAIIVPPNTHDKYEYYILIEAQEHGVFNVEARTSGAVIKLKENNLRFDSIKEGQQLCYEFNLKNKNDLVVEAKLIKGEVDFVFTSPEGKVEKANKIQNDKDLKETIASATKGLWQICAKTNSQVAFYSLHVYSNVVNAKEYKNILYSLLTKEELYDFQNREDSSRLNTLPMMRMLQEDQANEQPADTATNESDANTSNTTNNLETEVVPATTAANLSPIIVGLHISGTGVAGLVTVFVFLTPVLIGCYALMSIFVNTKFSDQPLKLGKID